MLDAITCQPTHGAEPIGTGPAPASNSNLQHSQGLTASSLKPLLAHSSSISSTDRRLARSARVKWPLRFLPLDVASPLLPFPDLPSWPRCCQWLHHRSCRAQRLHPRQREAALRLTRHRRIQSLVRRCASHTPLGCPVPLTHLTLTARITTVESGSPRPPRLA